MISYAGNTLWNNNATQRFAIIKSTIPYAGNIIRNDI